MIWHNISISEILNKLTTNEKCGLKSDEVFDRRKKYGENKLLEHKKTSIFTMFLMQFSDYMVIILLVAAAVSFITSIIQGEADFVDPIIILLIVIVNAIIGVVQESKAEKALEALKEMSSPCASVLRDGAITSLHSSELVVGDIIYLKAGDFVPADARLLDSVMLRVDEAALTGESHEVEKNHDIVLKEDTQIADIKNIVWSSTVVTYGRGAAVVVEIGMNTQVGKIAQMIISSETPLTPLQQKLAKTGQMLGTVALAICAVIFFMGLLRKMPALDMFMTSVSLAVAAIPEGLPAIVTIMLAIGVQKMARRNAIVRKLPAVETLGSATVICSDKTGTLTQNKMTVVDIYGNKAKTLLYASLCNNYGDPTEKAIITAFEKTGGVKNEIDKQYVRVSEIPFDSTRKMMTTVHKDGSRYKIIVKGAPDILINKCNLTKEQREQIVLNITKMSQNALRVLAVAYCDKGVLPKNLEENLEFVGLIGIIDPPRPEVKRAVRICKGAGIKPVMITGDNVETAIAIAKDIGIYSLKEKAMTGAQLNKITDDELIKNIFNYSVFARVTPEHKVRIVNAFQKRGAVVAMTGDGVNDAPALKTADIGCAMGISGTDVAKGAADMVLTDDNFATIVEAVKQGRGIYSNIRKSVHFLLSSNIGEIITIFSAILMGWQAPLIAIQLLWINLVTDSLPAIALGVDKIDNDIMENKPIERKKSLFSDGLGVTIMLEGIMIGLLALLAYGFGMIKFKDLTIARTMSFAVLGMSQLFHSFNIRSERSIFSIGVFSNIYLVIAFIICAIMQLGVITVPFLATIFKVSPLNIDQWIIVFLLSFMAIVIVEVQKFILHSKRREFRMYDIAK